MNITVENNAGIPKYKQIIASVENAIFNGEYKRGDKLPSINSIKLKFSLSRDTVLLAYSDLKTRGIIQSVPGKGYYIKTENVNTSKRIFLLFDEFNSFKENLYNSFLSNLGDGVEVDIFFHHFNHQIFSKLIYDNIGAYSSYVIMPANLRGTNNVISKLPSDSVYILDQTHKELAKYPAIYQNFEKDIIAGLIRASSILKRYKKLILLFSEAKQPQGMLDGFDTFCETYNFAQGVISQIQGRVPVKGEVYVIPEDRSLIYLLKQLKDLDLRLGEDVGIISYNDTILKEMVQGGITTISTDFDGMGKRLAKMVMNQEKVKIENPNHLILRHSL